MIVIFSVVAAILSGILGFIIGRANTIGTLCIDISDDDHEVWSFIVDTDLDKVQKKHKVVLGVKVTQK